MWPPRERTPQCASERTLVQRQADELTDETRAQVNAHLASCARCRGLADELDAERARFAELPVPMSLLRVARPRASRRPWMAVTGVIAVAAALVLWLRLRPGVPDSGTREKGNGAVATVYVKRGDVVHALTPGEVVAPGDRLRVVVRSTAPSHVALLAIDGGGQASVYLPVDAAATAALPAGDEVPLPGAVALDDVIGEERLFLLICSQATPLATIVRGLPSPALPGGCRLDALTLHKRRSGTP